MDYRAYLQRLVNDDYLKVIQDGLAYIKFDELLKRSKDSKVFIKANLTFPEYRRGVMTSIPAVEAAILAIREYTPNIYIGDSDSGGYNPFSMRTVYENTGLRAFAEKYNVHVVNLSDGPRKPIHFHYGGRSFDLNLPVLLTDDVDMTITMPVPKIHMNTGVSLGFKNQWGCIPEPQDRLKLHPFLHHVLVEVNRAIKTTVVIMDGKYGLNVSGPMKGEVVELNWVLVTNALGVSERLATALMGIEMEKIRHLRYAKSQGMIPDMKDIQLNQPYEPFVRQRFYLKRKWTDWPGYLAFNNPFLAWLAYFSPLSDLLHKILYLFREPFYDYEKMTSERAEHVAKREQDQTPRQ